ncbi:MAG: DUF5011 domain-containing protein [bacterium]|nr:DUF5011 domain-containing protein [bacterium]
MIFIQNSNGDTYNVITQFGLKGNINKNDLKIIRSGLNKTLENMNKSGHVVNVTTGLNFRENATLNSSIIRTLENNTNLKITGKQGDWYRVMLNGEQGFVYGDFINEGTSQVNTTVKSKNTSNSASEKVVSTNASHKNKKVVNNENIEKTNKNNHSVAKENNSTINKTVTPDTNTNTPVKPSTGTEVKPEEKPSTGTETKPEVKPTTYMAKIEQVSDKGNPIQGVKYKITYKDGTTEVVTVNGTELDLNNKGKAIDNIDVYEAPRGYIATNSETSTVSKDNTVTTIGKFTFKEVYSEYKNIINQKTKDGKAITGVEYKVTYKDGTTEIVKDNQPSLTLKDKQVEDITVAKTPAGYRLADTSSSEVNLSNNVVKLEYDFTFDRLNEAPSITGTNVTINQGSKFNTEMLNLKAKDDNDGDITKNIKVVKNDVNTQKPGTYNVTVQVTDSDGLTTSKTFTVTVKKVEEKRSWTYMPELSKQTFDALNAYRKANGLEPLEYSEKSAERAKARAEYNAEHNTADHTASQIGLYSNDGNAQSFIDSWAKSPLHKEDMLTKTYTGAGAGVYKDSEGRYFAVVDFYNDFWD